MKEFIDQLKFNIDGLIPAVAQQWDSGEILMMAWMSKQTLLKSLEQKRLFITPALDKLNGAKAIHLEIFK